MKIEGRTAVITGAGSGIGRAIALALARRGGHLALADVNAAGLAETEALARPHGVRVTGHHLDVADAAAVAALPAAVLDAHGGVQMVFNNAGVALGGTFEQVSEADFEWLMNINFYGVVRMTRAFLPLLRAAEEARIVNISSLFGLIAPPGQTAYSASKFAVRGFSEALRRELEAEGARIGVTTVHPGGVATSIAANARVPHGVDDHEQAKRARRMEKLLRMPPAKAGEIIVEGVAKRRARVIVGSDARFAALIERVSPVGYWKYLGRGMS
jgi:NAD(P)-dependent dehydrogenase (short-subunit alcohol dehydrogenase family)